MDKTKEAEKGSRIKIYTKETCGTAQNNSAR
jgi:hypothetical protein